MSSDLSRKRCLNHAAREAVARCPECGRYFCRECVTEHQGRVVCASCLVRLTQSKEKDKKRLVYLLRAVQFLVGLAVLFLFFSLMAHGLLSLPESFHEGTIWSDKTEERG